MDGEETGQRRRARQSGVAGRAGATGRWAFPAGVTAPAAALLTLAAVGMALAVDTPENQTRDMIDQWVQTKSLVSKERQDWRVGRQVMQERVALLQREIDGLREKTSQATNDVGDVDRQLAALGLEKEAMKGAVEELQRGVVTLETSVGRLVRLAPDPVRERVKPLTQRLPLDSANTKTPLAERVQVAIGILNELTKANGEVVQAVEIRALSGGSSAEVRTLYVGLAQGYFVSAKGEAGIGVPGENGWTWGPANDLAPAIEEVLAIMQNKGSPRFIPLPVKIK